MALNGGPVFKFNEAISLVVNCDTQDEVAYYWKRLGKGGNPKPSNAAGSRTSTLSYGRSCRALSRSS